jgi:spore germination protein
MNRNAGRAAARSEVIKFGLLTAVLLLLVLGLALARPLLFGHILPIALGLPAVSADGGGLPVETPYPAAPDTTGDHVIAPPILEEAPAPVEEDVAQPNSPEEQTAAPETAVTPPAADLLHIVQPGETLTRIAERYNVTVAALVTANGITNPNQIPAGMALRVPQP